MKLYYKYFLICALLMCSYATMWGDVLTHSVSFPTTARHTQVVTLDDGRQYVELKYDNTESTSAPGAPSLPVRYIKLSVPYNACNFSVSCTYRTRTSARASKKIIPCEQPITTNYEAIDSLYIVEDSTIYSNNALYPASLGEVVSEGYFMGSNHVITIAVYPSQYNPVSGQLYFYGSVTATVRYDIDEQCQNILSRYDSQLRDEEQQIIMSMVENGVQVPVFAAPPVTPPGNVQLLSSNSSSDIPCDSLDINIEEQRAVESYEYTIITTRELKPAFKRLVALKRQKGLDAGVVCIEDIMANPIVNMGDVMYDRHHNYISTIADSAGVVREYLKYAFAYGTKYVLIGGQGLPFRYKYSSLPFRKQPLITLVPTDLYFSDLESQWYPVSNNAYDASSNNASINLFVGRLLCRNSDDIDNYIQKLFRYDFNPGNGDASYLKRGYFYEAHDMYRESSYVIPELRNIHVLDTVIREQENPPYTFGSEIINEINNTKYGYISLHAHGSPNGMKICEGANDHDLRSIKALRDQRCVPKPSHWVQEESNGLDNLTNKDYPNIIYSISCTVMPFDIYTNEYGFTYNVFRNMGDSFTSGKDYGGVAFLGNTREGLKNYSYLLERDFIKQINNRVWSLGQAEMYSRLNFNLSSKVYEFHLKNAHNLLGDPEVEMWTNEPLNIEDVSVARNDDSIVINANATGIDSLYVGIYDGIRQRKDTICGSKTITGVNPNSIVMVYKHDYLPYIAPLNIQNEQINSSRYLISNDVNIGNSVDSNRTSGPVTIDNGASYEIESKGNVTLYPGVDIKLGASFNILQSKY